MGDIGDFFFGKDEVTPAQQVGSASLLTPEQETLLKTLLGQAQTGISGGAEVFPGQFAAGPSPIQGKIFGDVQSVLSGGQPEGPYGDILGKLLSGEQTTVPEFDKQGTEQFFRESVVDPALRAFTEDILPVIQEKFISQNALDSGGYNRAVARETGDFTKDLAAQLGQLVYGSQQANEARRFQAGESAMGRAQGALTGITGVGGTQRDVLSDLLAGEIQKFTMQQPYGNPYLGLIGPLLGQRAFEPIIQGPSTTSKPGLFDYAQATANIFSALKPSSGNPGTTFTSPTPPTPAPTSSPWDNYLQNYGSPMIPGF